MKPLSMEEAAEYLGYSVGHMRQFVAKAELACCKPGGGKLFFNPEDLDAFVYRHRVPSKYDLEERAIETLNNPVRRRRAPSKRGGLR
jgi:excisionase family DNA binding protein